MKLCPECGNCLKKIDPYELACTHFEYAFCIYYKCPECGDYYAYCNLCSILINEFGVTKHELKHPKQNTVARENFYRFDQINGDLSESIYILYPQLYTMSAELPFTVEDPFMSYRNNYSCALCDMDYDAFPSLKRVRRHLRVCTSEKLNQ